jgi:cytochrome P450
VNDLGKTIMLTAMLYGGRVGVAYSGYVRRDPLTLFKLSRVDPYRVCARIRARGELVPASPGEWMSATYRVCDSVLRDRRFGARVEDGAPTGPDKSHQSMMAMNPPDHTRLRRLASPAFSPRPVAGYAEKIEQTVGSLLDRAGEAGTFDLVPAIAMPVPIAVISELLGIPDSMSADFTYHGITLGSGLNGIRSLRHLRAMKASDTRLCQLFEELIALRQRQPGDDIVSRLVAAGQEQVTPEEMVSMCILLLIAGFKSTVNLISNGILALLGDRAQWEALCADPEGMAPRAVEETLRYDAPVQRTARMAREPVELGGQLVRKGEIVIVLLGGANRDPEAFERPDVFDIRRDSKHGNLAFASGIHYCLGQPLAQLEATITLRMLAERLPGLTRAGAIRRGDGSMLRGPLRMPVTVERRPAAARRSAPAVSVTGDRLSATRALGVRAARAPTGGALGARAPIA